MSKHIEQSMSIDPAAALHLSQSAPRILSKPAPASSFFPLSLFKTPESPDVWAEHEQLFLSCLRTGDDSSAHQLLERITNRFGAKDERVMAMKGLYREAVAKDEKDLQSILTEYEMVLSEDAMNIVSTLKHAQVLQMLMVSANSEEDSRNQKIHGTCSRRNNITHRASRICAC